MLWCTYTSKTALANSDDKMTEFSILREVRREVSRTATSDFQRANSGLFRRQVEAVYIFFSLCKDTPFYGVHGTDGITVLKCQPCRIKACITTEKAQGKGRWTKVNKIMIMQNINPFHFF